MSRGGRQAVAGLSPPPTVGRPPRTSIVDAARGEGSCAPSTRRMLLHASRGPSGEALGHPPLGYDVRDRKLVVNAAEVETVRSIFRRFLTVGSATILARTLATEGVTTKRGRAIDKGDLYKILNNRVRSEEHTSELQSLMRISYACLCLKKKIKKKPT